MDTSLSFKNMTSNSSLSSQLTSSASHSRSLSSFYIALALLYIPGLVTNVIALRLIVRDIRFVDIPTNMLLFSLCLTDLIAIINSLVWHTIRRFIPVLPYSLCFIKSFFGPFFPIYSGLISTLMALDRFLALSAPYFYAQHITCLKWRITAVVLAATHGFICFFPKIGLGEFWKLRTYHGRVSYSCISLSYQADPMKRTFIAIYVIVGLAIVATIAICNLSVLIILIKMRKRVHAAGAGGMVNESEKASLEIEFAKLVGLLTCAFLVCWTPYHISIIFNAFNLKMSSTSISYIHLLAGMNYTTDPLVYLLARKAYRNRILEFFRNLWRKVRD